MTSGALPIRLCESHRDMLRPNETPRRRVITMSDLDDLKPNHGRCRGERNQQP